ncbi:helix-turn-helix domain-containing protein [Luteimonas sp. WGS1318]|uniref:AraC family transcriptional regulator n=1 Tax=Luteimonas sp. WGS1318 TaxID=3366815 RepID=UPI00372D5155
MDLPQAPILATCSAGLSGMAFLELGSGDAAAGVAAPVRDDAFLIALQLRPCTDFDLYADGRLVRPRGFDTGNVAIFDLRENLATERREAFHAIDLYLPQAALAAVAEDAGTVRIDDLRHDTGAAFRDPVAHALLSSIRPALAMPAQANQLFLDHVALALTSHVAHTYGGMRPRPAVQAGALAAWQLRRAQDLLRANLAGRVTLAELAGVCELSIRHFTRAFRASTGTSPHGWLMRLRVERARDLLVDRHVPLGELALACGFADQSHFTRVFHQHLGMSPGAYRRLHRT